tara:strand:+ start:686 stop:919 length:234 start_codon:yes stop_codon:yes gene_type:complete
MIKKILFILILFLIPNNAWSFSCPSLMAKIDNAIASSEINAERLEVIEFLRDKGETFHSLGDHEASEVTLNAAVDLL